MVTIYFIAEPSEGITNGDTLLLNGKNTGDVSLTSAVGACGGAYPFPSGDAPGISGLIFDRKITGQAKLISIAIPGVHWSDAIKPGARITDVGEYDAPGHLCYENSIAYKRYQGNLN
jgi:hypothetical protein